MSYRGRRVHLDDAQMLPRPVQQPHPPLWIGGTGRHRTLPLVARMADVWHAFGSTASYRELSGILDDLAHAAGRDPRDIVRARSLSLSDPLDEVRRNVDQWQEEGVGYLVCGWPSEGRAAIERIAEAVFES